MFESELVMYAFNLHMLHRLSHDVAPDQLDQRMHGVGHTPRWILGHLAISTDYALQLLGGTRACPAAWHKTFGPGSSDETTDAANFDKSALVQAVTRGHEQVCLLAPKATPAVLMQPHSVPFFKDTPFTTAGHIVSHLLATHEAYHLGQLSAWRRQAGFTPLY